LAFWLACQIGSQYFGSVAAILLKVPGEASSIIFIEDLNKVSTAERYDLIRQTAWGSTIGSVISLALLLVVYYLGFGEHLLVLTKTTTKIIVLTALIVTLIYFTKNRLASAVLFFVGLFLAEKTNEQLPTWVFNMQTYTTDITVFSMILGLMIIPEFIKEVSTKITKDPLSLNTVPHTKLDIKSMLKGTWIGSLVGFIPGPSAILASVLTYNSNKRDSIKQRIISSEAANNSAAVTSMLPFLFIGLPITLSEMILADIFQVKLFVMPTDFQTKSILPGMNLIEFCFLIVAIYTLIYHFLAQRFLGFYERFMEFAYGKLKWLYIILVIYLINIDTTFNPVYLPRYLLFMAVLTAIGWQLMRRQISVLPAIFGFILGDIIAWAFYNFYLINL
jgi:TctA family transporter